MALVPIDSTNFTVGTNAVSTVTFGPGFRGLKVQSVADRIAAIEEALAAADPRVAAALAADPRSAVTDG